MKVYHNSVIPFKEFAAINICGILFVRNGVVVTDRLLNHERIHTAQIKEMLYVFFYLLYGLEWILKLFKYRLNSYYNISFEREAYRNERNMEYLKERKAFAWINFIFNTTWGR